MTTEARNPRKKKSLLSKVSSVTVSAIGLILMTGGGEHADISGFSPSMYGAKGKNKFKDREGVPAPDQMRADACRVLYIPKHNSSIEGVNPVYDFTQEYRDKLRDENIGSDKWKYTLGLMSKPDGKDGTEVAYMVEVEQADKATREQFINVRRECLNATQISTTMPLPAKDLDTPFTFSTPPSTSVYTVATNMSPSLTAEATAQTQAPSPWFTITLTDSSTSYQWQVHPAEHGPLRYTLIDLPSPGHIASVVEPENQHRIKAIYHNVGVGTSLVQPFSEGVLLLPANKKDMDASLEIAIVTSLIGVLWRARGAQSVKLEVPISKADTGRPKAKNGSFFRKSWNNKEEVDVIR